MIELELTREQRQAIDAGYDECFAILGAPATGKSTALRARADRARLLYPAAEPLVINVDRRLDQYAVTLLASLGIPVTLIDDVEAESLFWDVCSPLFALEWDEFARGQLDPEVPGLRSPQRFAAAAFRLVRRLRDANIAPRDFLGAALTGATDFYANPPNFCDPSLLTATKAAFHDSLEVTPAELERQRLRELDLAKILAKLYEAYVDVTARSGRMTGRDALIAASARVRDNAPLGLELRRRHRCAFVDDAQDLTAAEVELLAEIFGSQLTAVTLCGDPTSAISTTRMTHPDTTFARAASRVALGVAYRLPRVETARTSTELEEAQLIAQRVCRWLEEGVAPEKIAVLFRSVGNVEIYETALLDCDIAVAVAGDVNLFRDRRALDAIALLWNVYDPFRHEWLLRTLAGPSIGLSDASLATLCSEPADPQRQLFIVDDESAPTARANRWDPKRDLRLGWNVIRGERDDALSPDAAARLRRFRALREGWLFKVDAEPLGAFVRGVWQEGLAREGAIGSARARGQQRILRRLLALFSEFVEQRSSAGIAHVLAYAQERIDSELEMCAPFIDEAGCIQMLSVEAARGLEFEHAVVANVRPGAFPLWYSPEAFLFSPRFGMIPKENVGDARSARTAKFTYCIFRTKPAQRYNKRERNAFDYALRRARQRVLVTASGPPTRGATAPEFLEELR